VICQRQNELYCTIIGMIKVGAGNKIHTKICDMSDCCGLNVQVSDT
jgi:hypothetical protein